MSAKKLHLVPQEQLRLGAPQSREEAINRALMFGPLKGISQRVCDEIRNHDSQVVGAFLLKHWGNKEVETAIAELWEQLTGEKL